MEDVMQRRPIQDRICMGTDFRNHDQDNQNLMQNRLRYERPRRHGRPAMNEWEEEDLDADFPYDYVSQTDAIYGGVDTKSAYKMKLEVPTYDGKIDIEGFLDYIVVVEDFFECMKIPESQQVKLVSYKLKGGAASWWRQTVHNRRLRGEAAITSWSLMRRLMKARFLPFDYAQKLFQSYQLCSQNRRPIDEYTQEFYRFGSRVNLSETEVQQVSRYLSGLDPELKEVLYLHPISMVTDAVSLAQKIEPQPKIVAKAPGESKRSKPALVTST